MSEARSQNVEQFVDNLHKLGRSWATLGLQLGRTALEASASRLKITADFLGTVSDKISCECKKDETKEEPRAEATAENVQ